MPLHSIMPIADGVFDGAGYHAARLVMPTCSGHSTNRFRQGLIGGPAARMGRRAFTNLVFAEIQVIQIRILGVVSTRVSHIASGQGSPYFLQARSCSGDRQLTTPMRMEQPWVFLGRLHHVADAASPNRLPGFLRSEGAGHSPPPRWRACSGNGISATT